MRTVGAFSSSAQGKRVQASQPLRRTHNGCQAHRGSSSAIECASDDGRRLKSISTFDRRCMVASLFAAASLAGSTAGPAEAAVASDVTTYTDDQDLFSIAVPAGWTFAVPAEKYDRFRSAGVSSRRVLTWFPESGTDVNISIVVTTPGADYTSLASFGSASDWGYNLVQSMDRSFMARRSKEEPPMVANLIKTESVGGTYVTEYTTKAKGEEQKYLISKVAMGSNGRLRRFFTVTAIFPEAKAPEVQKLLRSCLDTFTYTSETA